MTTAQALASHPRFRWEGGQLTLCGVRLFEGGYRYIVGHRRGPTRDGGGFVDTDDVSGFVPDLKDAATIGTIEAQARAFYQNLIVYPPDYPGESWAISRGPIAGDGSCVAYAPTRGECWALAFLEVAGAP